MELIIGKLYYPKPGSQDRYPIPMSVEGITEWNTILVQGVNSGFIEEITKEEMEYHFYTTDD